MDAILQLDQNILLFIQEYTVMTGWTGSGKEHTLGDFGIFWILHYNRSADS